MTKNQKRINFVCLHLRANYKRYITFVNRWKINGYDIVVEYVNDPKQPGVYIAILQKNYSNVTDHEFEDRFIKFFDENIMSLETFLMEIIYELL